MYDARYLHSGLGEADPHGDLLAHENVRIVGLAETPFQLVQLRRREPGSVSLLLVRLAGVVSVGPATGRSDSRSGGKPVAGRAGQVETATRQSERSTTATTANGRGQLRRRGTVALVVDGTCTAATTDAVAASDVVDVSVAAGLQLVKRSMFEAIEVLVACAVREQKKTEKKNKYI